MRRQSQRRLGQCETLIVRLLPPREVRVSDESAVRDGSRRAPFGTVWRAVSLRALAIRVEFVLQD